MIKGKYNGVEMEFDESQIETSFCTIADKDNAVKKVEQERDSFKTKYEEAKKQYEEAFNGGNPKPPSGDELLDTLKNTVKELFK